MYCRNCGAQMDSKAAVCISCGVVKNNGSNYCPNCGAKTSSDAAVCLKCGVALSKTGNYELKQKTVAALLGIFLGGLGIHNFYLGYTKKAIIQLVLSLTIGLFTLGLPALWGFIEGLMILFGKITTDANGNPLE